MPMIWTKPTALMTHRGVTIYHTYKNQCSESINSYWYSADEMESEGWEFDVRTLPAPAGVDSEDHKLIIQHALDRGLLDRDLPDEVAIEPYETKVEAEIWTDDHHHEVIFDAANWLAQASIDEILALQVCGWRGDRPADAVGEFMEGRDWRINGLFHYLRTQELPEDLSGFEVRVDEEQAMAYLEAHCEETFWQVQCALGRAVKITAVFDEDVTIRKEVETFVMLDTEQQKDFLEFDERGCLAPESVLNLKGDDYFGEAVGKAVREAAYEQLITEGDHGWEVIESEGSRIDAFDIIPV